ncbi:uncharacterized protein E6C27_scaffold34G001660 [Cucumis melo var. makuwa]|uniref:Beta-galactosidase n=1 Tax=Cucumis melo var. makuwa TaxID=1194695 RepID=A0A5A7SMI1_CUCMM|nr:uncharacterized protein E6C27_scaffold34G001660 [Cucumis melo var. makuwa]
MNLCRDKVWSIPNDAFGPRINIETRIVENQSLCKHKKWHTNDQCWKLHGRPPGGKKWSSNEKQNSGCAYISETTPTNTSQSSGSTTSQIKTPTLNVIAPLSMP